MYAQKGVILKKGLVLSIVALAAIVIVASFHMQVSDAPSLNISESMAGNILYVCPSANPSWDSIAFAFRPFVNYIIAGLFFAMVILVFVWGWQLYQNMLSDKFKRESFKNVWMCTKIWAWGIVIVMLILITPNAFRRVEITGAGDNWVLCDISDLCNPYTSDCPTKVVRADVVHAR